MYLRCYCFVGAGGSWWRVCVCVCVCARARVHFAPSEGEDRIGAQEWNLREVFRFSRRLSFRW